MGLRLPCFIYQKKHISLVDLSLSDIESRQIRSKQLVLLNHTHMALFTAERKQIKKPISYGGFEKERLFMMEQELMNITHTTSVNCTSLLLETPTGK